MFLNPKTHVQHFNRSWSAITTSRRLSLALGLLLHLGFWHKGFGGVLDVCMDLCCNCRWFQLLSLRKLLTLLLPFCSSAQPYYTLGVTPLQAEYAAA